MKYELVLIGSGNLATALGTQLHSAGHRILQVYSRDILRANLLASKIQSIGINSIDSINTRANIYLICIKDGAIGEFSKKLAKVLSSDKLIAHSSGVNSPEIIHDTFLYRGLFYPLQSFSLNKIPDWEKIPIFIEGNPQAVFPLKALAESISKEVMEMNENIRTHLHLASVIANNFTNYNLIIAKKILDKAGVPFNVLNSLMKETVEKAFAIDPLDAQTGPAKRGDTKSIEKHIRLLVKEFPEYRSLYKKYSQIIQQDFRHANHRTNTSS